MVFASYRNSCRHWIVEKFDNDAVEEIGERADRPDDDHKPEYLQSVAVGGADVWHTVS